MRICGLRLSHAACAPLMAIGALLLGLAFATPATAAPAARQNPIPPPEAGCFLGAYVHDATADSLAEFNQSAGKPHALFLRFVAIGHDGFDKTGPDSLTAFCDACADLGAVPYLTLEPWHATASSLLSPDDRAWVEEFATRVGDLNRPVFIRFAHEMNGNWYPWGWTNVTPSVYIQGFQEVAAIFRERAPLAAMVWAPSQNWGNNCDHVYSNWYPGDQYVDWVGLTSYQWSYGGLMARQFYYSIAWGEGAERNFYQAFAVGHDKPMMIAETAAGDDDPAYYDTEQKARVYGTEPGQGAQNWWIPQVYSDGPDYSSLRSAFPRIQAITWFGKGDWNFGGTDPTQHSSGFSTYASAVSGSYWLSRATTPVTTISTLPAGWVSHDVTFTLSAQDAGSTEGVSTFFGLNQPAETPYSHAVTISNEGTTTVSFRSVGLSGALERSKTATVNIDKSAPLTTDDHRPLYEEAATVRLAATDEYSGVASTEWRLDDGEWAAGTSVIVPTAGVHSLRYRSTDVAGNQEETREARFEVVRATKMAFSTKSSASLPFGSVFAAGGTLTSRGAGLPGRRVILQSARPGADFTDTSLVTTTSAGGVFAFRVRPTTKTYYRVRFAGSPGYGASRCTESVYAVPSSSVGTPRASSTMRHTRYYTVRGCLRPAHAARTFPVRIYRWRKTTTGRWKSYGYVRAKASDCPSHLDCTDYSARLRLPRSGRWRLRAYAPADSGHAGAWSPGFDYVWVK